MRKRDAQHGRAESQAGVERLLGRLGLPRAGRLAGAGLISRLLKDKQRRQRRSLALDRLRGAGAAAQRVELGLDAPHVPLARADLLQHLLSLPRLHDVQTFIYFILFIIYKNFKKK
jgi:hypothetical protein